MGDETALLPNKYISVKNEQILKDTVGMQFDFKEFKEENYKELIFKSSTKQNIQIVKTDQLPSTLPVRNEHMVIHTVHEMKKFTCEDCEAVETSSF